MFKHLLLSRPSIEQCGLAGWPSQRPRAPFVGALRASHSGTAFRER